MRRIKMGLAVLALWLLAVSGTVFADTFAPDWNDPDYVKLVAKQERTAGTVDALTVSKNPNANPFTGLEYTHDEAFADCKVVLGVDVSKYQAKVDWKKAKKAGVEFAIIRVGYTGLSDGKMHKDSEGLSKDYFALNIAGAKAAGVKVGVYYFSQAINVKEAHAEAEYVLDILDGMELDYPVVFDFEEFTGYRLAKAKLKAAAGTKICEAFCEDVKDAGYDPMVYVGYNATIVRKLVDAKALGKKYPLWISRYNTFLNYPYTCSYWQYTDVGKVSGISGGTDCNFQYVPQEEEETTEKEEETSEAEESETETETEGESSQESEAESSSEETSEAESESPQETKAVVTLGKPTGLTAKASSHTKIKLTWKAVKGAASYNVYRATRYGGTYKKLTSVKKTTYTDTDLKEGQEVYYKVESCAPDAKSKMSGSVTGRTTYSKSCKVKTDGALAVWMRKKAGKNEAQVVAVPGGTTCTLLAYTRASDNVMWFRVKAKVKGKSYTGYISSKYAVVAAKKVTGLKKSTNTATSITMKWTGQSGVTGYKVYRAAALNGKYKLVKTVKDATSYKDTKLSKYCVYYYKVRAYSTINGKTTYGAYSDAAVLYTKKTSFSVKSKTSLAVRKYAGTSYKKLVNLYSGTKAKVSFRTKDAAGAWWYYINVKVKGKTYKGYVKASYTKKT